MPLLPLFLKRQAHGSWGQSERIVGVVIKKSEDNASGKMYIILSLLSSSNLHHNPLISMR